MEWEPQERFKSTIDQRNLMAGNLFDAEEGTRVLWRVWPLRGGGMLLTEGGES